MNEFYNRKIIVLFIFIVIIAISLGVYFVVFINNKKVVKVISVNKDMQENIGKEAALNTQQLINEVKNKNKKVETEKTQTNNIEDNKIEVVQGANKIDTEFGTVVNEKGQKVDNSVNPGNYKAPMESAPISIDDAPKSGIILKMTAENIDPPEFTVKRNQVVSLTIISGDKWTHILKFKDPSLKGVSLGISPKVTRSILFNAPDKAGEYVYYDEMSNFELRGATGKMIVE